MKTVTITALTLSSLTLAACGGKSKEAYDTMMGDNKRADSSFHVDPASLPGTYVYMDDDHQEIWRFANNKVELYRPDDAAGCPIARPYHLDGNNIVAEATPPCGTNVYKIQYQAVIPSGPNLSALMLSDGAGSHSLSKVDDDGAKDAFFSFAIHPELVPADMQAFIPKEPSDDAIKTAREAFRTEFTNAHVKLTKSVATLALAGAATQNYAVAFTGGKASSVANAHDFSFLHSAGRTGVDCYLWATDPQEVANFGGFDLSVASAVVRHSRRVNGAWELEQLRAAADGKSLDRSPVIKEDLNANRGNSLLVNFEAAKIDSPADNRLTTNLSLICLKPRGPDVLTLADVTNALGDYFEIASK